MNNDSSCCNKTRFGAYAVAIVGTCLIGAAFVSILRSETRPKPIGTARIEERKKAFAEVSVAKQELSTYGYVDAAKGVVRLPIDRAMEMVVSNWKNPAAGRSNLITRFDAANPPPPPPKPAKPSEFE